MTKETLQEQINDEIHLRYSGGLDGQRRSAAKWGANFVADKLLPEIDRLKGLLEEVYKGTGNKIMAKVWGEDLETHWQQFKTENQI